MAPPPHSLSPPLSLLPLSVTRALRPPVVRQVSGGVPGSAAFGGVPGSVAFGGVSGGPPGLCKLPLALCQLPAQRCYHALQLQHLLPGPIGCLADAHNVRHDGGSSLEGGGCGKKEGAECVRRGDAQAEWAYGCVGAHSRVRMPGDVRVWASREKWRRHAPWCVQQGEAGGNRGIADPGAAGPDLSVHTPCWCKRERRKRAGSMCPSAEPQQR